MIDVFDDIANDIAKKAVLLNDEPARRLAERISLRSKSNSQSGKAFGNDRYDNEYTARYAKQAKKGKRSPVTLRNGKNRIEKQRVEVITTEGAQISFDELGDVFNYHDKGINYKNAGFKQRSIMPKSAESLDQDIYDDLKQDVFEVLDGR